MGQNFITKQFVKAISGHQQAETPKVGAWLFYKFRGDSGAEPLCLLSCTHRIQCQLQAVGSSHNNNQTLTEKPNPPRCCSLIHSNFCLCFAVSDQNLTIKAINLQKAKTRHSMSTQWASLPSESTRDKHSLGSSPTLSESYTWRCLVMLNLCWMAPNLPPDCY